MLAIRMSLGTADQSTLYAESFFVINQYAGDLPGSENPIPSPNLENDCAKQVQ